MVFILESISQSLTPFTFILHLLLPCSEKPEQLNLNLLA